MKKLPMTTSLKFKYQLLVSLKDMRDKYLDRSFLFRKPSLEIMLGLAKEIANAHAEFWIDASTTYPEVKGVGTATSDFEFISIPEEVAEMVEASTESSPEEK